MRLAVAVSALAFFTAGCVAAIGDLAPPNADPQAGCALACHGADSSNAPPKALAGATETTAVGVGAHQRHLDPAPTWHHAIACADCHVVPTQVDSPGHLDGDGRAELTFSARAGVAMWDGTTCTTACHGNAGFGGTRTQPTWTLVDGSQATCGSCHGTPPPAPHPAATDCASCHPTMEEGSLTFRDPDSHINGVVDVVSADETGGCTTCHGSPTSAAPPTDLTGETAPTVAGVGAHQAHLQTSTWRHEITCSNCHVVPTTIDAPGHRDGDNVAEVIFDALNPEAGYAQASSSCENLYCHGNGRGNDGARSWITPGALVCGDCHSVDGEGMSGRHRKHLNEGIPCVACHLDVVDVDLGITDANLHINGLHEVRMVNGNFDAGGGNCSNVGCHGTEDWY